MRDPIQPRVLYFVCGRGHEHRQVSAPWCVICGCSIWARWKKAE